MNALKEKISESPGLQLATAIIAPWIGALPGLAVLVLISNLGRISSVSSLVIMLGALWAYGLSGKTAGKAACTYIFLINAVVTVAGEALAMYSSIAWGMVTAYGSENLGLVLEMMPEVLGEYGAFWPDVWANSILGLVFAFAGWFLILSKARGDAESKNTGIYAPGRSYQPIDDADEESQFRETERVWLARCARNRAGEAFTKPPNWMIAVCGLISVIGFAVLGFGLLTPYYRDSGAGLFAALMAMGLFEAALGFLLIRRGAAMNGESVVVRGIFFTRTVDYGQLRAGARREAPRLARAAVLFATDDKPLRVQFQLMANAEPFLRVLAARAETRLPLGYEAVKNRGDIQEGLAMVKLIDAKGKNCPIPVALVQAAGKVITL